jgi:hypothetical protein
VRDQVVRTASAGDDHRGVLGERDGLEGIFKMFARWIFGIAAAASFALAIFLLLWRSDSAGAAVASGLFLVSALLIFLPDIEVLKAFGIEAKLRAKLSEADEILQKLRRLGAVNAKMAYQQLGWGNRIGGARSIEKQRLADEVDQVLRDLGGAPEELSSMKRDYLRFAVFDLSQLFNSIVDMRVDKIQKMIRNEIKSLEGGESEGIARLRDEISEIEKKNTEMRLKRFDARAVGSFSEHSQLRLSVSPRLSNDSSLQNFAGRVQRLMDEIIASQRVTDAAAELIDSSGLDGRKTLYQEIFSEASAQ